MASEKEKAKAKKAAEATTAAEDTEAEANESPVLDEEKKETRVIVLDVTFGDAGPGDEISIPKASAEYYSSIGYVEILED